MSEVNLFRILLIDDNPAIQKDSLEIFTAHQLNVNHQAQSHEVLPYFQIDTASQGREGVDKFATALQMNRPYALVIIDIRTPLDWSGVDIVKHISEFDQDSQIVLCAATIEPGMQDYPLLVLKKPFDNIALHQLVYVLQKKWQSLHKHFSLEEEDSFSKKSWSVLRKALAVTHAGVLVVNNQGELIDWNPKLNHVLHLAKTILEAGNFSIFCEFIRARLERGNQLDEVLNNINENSDESLMGYFTFKDKRIFEYYTQPYQLKEQTLGRIWTFRDIGDEVALDETLHYQATQLVLTGIEIVNEDRCDDVLIKAIMLMALNLHLTIFTEEVEHQVNGS